MVDNGTATDRTPSAPIENVREDPGSGMSRTTTPTAPVENVREEYPGMSVDRVAVRLPQFWPDDPEVWFAQVEAQFEVAGIKTDATKYFQIIRELDHKTAREVRDILTNPPRTGKYEKLKTELINRLSISHENRKRQLLTHEELGDRTPSQFLRHLRALALGGVSDDFLRTMWSSRLPTQVQAIIASQKSASLEDIAILADQIMEVAPGPSQVASASASTFEDMFRRLEQSITSRIQNELSQQIAQLNLNGNGRRSRFHDRSRSRSRSKSRGRSQSRKPGMCWYHSIFSDNARKCTPPCNFKAEN